MAPIDRWLPLIKWLPRFWQRSEAAQARGADQIRGLLQEGGSDALHRLDQVDFRRLTTAEIDALVSDLRDLREALTEEEEQKLGRRDRKCLKKVLKRTLERRPPARHLAWTSTQTEVDFLETDRHARRDLPGQRAKSGLVARTDRRRGHGALDVDEIAPADDEALLERTPVDDADLLDQLTARLVLMLRERGEMVPGGGPTATAEARSDALPEDGHSGRLRQMPMSEYAPRHLHEVCKRLGMLSVRDFLACGRYPDSRRLIAHALGVPATKILVASHRAELLDLAIPLRTVEPPRLAEILLLSSIGIARVADLRTLGDLSFHAPARFTLLAQLTETLQRTIPRLAARRRITERTLTSWARAARSRPSGILVPECDAHASTEEAAQSVLAWWLKQRASEPMALWEDAVGRLLRLLWSCGGDLDARTLEEVERLVPRETLAAFFVGVDSDCEDASTKRDERRNPDDRHDPYAQTLLSDVWPRIALDGRRDDGAVRFCVEPTAPWQQAGQDTDGPVRGRYVCLDPRTGAIFFSDV